MQARISQTVAPKTTETDHPIFFVPSFLKSYWPFKLIGKEEDEPKKFKYVTSTSTKSVEELWNEIVGQSKDDNAFYTNLMCATIISAIGLMSNR
jgi:hypothetical protein